MTERHHSLGSVGRLLATYTKPHARLFGLGIVTNVLARIPEVLPVFLVGIAFDAVFLGSRPYTLPLVPQSWIPETDIGQLWFTVGVLAVAYLLKATLDWFSTVTYGKYKQEFLHDLRTDTYDVMQRLELGFFDDQQTGEVMSILNNDVNQLQKFLRGGLSSIAHFGSYTLAILIFLVILNWQLTLVVLLFPLSVAAFSYWTAKLLEPKYERMRASVGDLNSRLENNIGGIEVIKAYTTEDRESDRITDASRTYFDLNWDVITTRVKIRPTMGAFRGFYSAVIFLIGAYWILEGPPLFFSTPLTVGGLFTFLMYVTMLREPMNQLGQVIDRYEDARASANRVTGLVDDGGRIEEGSDAIPVEDVVGDVAYDDVSFAYEDANQTIEDVTFTVTPGEMVGIVGPTGAGKSTLIKLLLRFYDVNDGEIRIDGTDIRDLTLKSLRRSIGYVSQDPFLFYGTVRENIAYSDRNVVREEVVRAATQAGAHEFITDLPDGYDTMVGERGVKLSGGQRQRVSIARALLNDPAILVLDEAMSHVDNATEVVIQQHLEELTADRTTFAIAHRLSTVRDADRILVMDDGKLVEQGTHEALLDADETYADLWRVHVGNVDSVSDQFLADTAHTGGGGGQ